MQQQKILWNYFNVNVLCIPSDLIVLQNREYYNVIQQKLDALYEILWKVFFYYFPHFIYSHKLLMIEILGFLCYGKIQLNNGWWVENFIICFNFLLELLEMLMRTVRICSGRPARPVLKIPGTTVILSAEGLNCFRINHNVRWNKGKV